MPRKRTNPNAIKQSSSRKKSNKSRTKVVCNCSRCNGTLVDWRTKYRHEQLVAEKIQCQATYPYPILKMIQSKKWIICHKSHQIIQLDCHLGNKKMKINKIRISKSLT